MKIILVRHGETEANADGIMQGQKLNHILNDKGIRQAKTLKQKLLSTKIDICFTSPLARTWSTAMILVGERVEIKEDGRLIERYLGKWEGENKEGYDPIKYWNYNLNSNDDGVEPIQDIFTRCNSFIDDLKRKCNDDDTILVVSHSATIRCLHHILKNNNLNKNLVDFKIENCYCNKYELKKEG